MVVREGLLQWRDRVDGGHPAIQPSAIISALRPSPATATTTIASSGTPGGGGARGGRGALVAGWTPGGRWLVQAVGQMGQLAESRIPMWEGRWRVWRGWGAPMLLVLVVGVLKVWVWWRSWVVLGQGRSRSNLRGEVPTKTWADMVREVLEQQRTVVCRGGVEEADVLIDDG